MNVQDIHTVTVAGAGTMGQQIALQCAWYGYQVKLYDLNDDILSNADCEIGLFVQGFVNHSRLDARQAGDLLACIHSTCDLGEAAQTDLLSESVVEDPAVKAQLFFDFGRLAPEHAIFTTNTSSLLPSMFAQFTGRPERFAALHFHTYVWDSPVADVMPHPGTAPETVQLLADFARSIGQTPIVLTQESYGYVFNAMYNALNRAAISLAARHVASVEDIDRAWMGVMKMPLGPFGMLDHVGIETAWHITDYWARTLGDPEMQTHAAFLKQYVDAGHLGVKTGQGFYTYPDPAYTRPGFLQKTD